MLIKIEAGKPIGNPITNENFYQLFPETSFPFPLQPSAVDPFGYGMYEYSAQPTPGTYEKAVEVSPVKNDQGIWMQTWKVVSMTPEEVAEKNDQLRQQNKSEATWLLQVTDWTAPASIADPAESNPYLANRSEFLSYRSQVRQIAVNPPVTVSEWPAKPDEVWVTV